MRFFINSKLPGVNFVDGLRSGVVNFCRFCGVGDGHTHVVNQIDKLKPIWIGNYFVSFDHI